MTNASSLPTLETIVLSRNGRKLSICLNRPDRLNAFDRVMHRELVDAINFATLDTDSDVIVLTGAGRAFSAGGDLAWQRDAFENPRMFEATVREARQIVYGLLDCEKPVLARINGPAVGLGATLALFCDLSIIARSAFLADPHVKVGMVAGDGAAIIWPQLVGFARAKEFLLIGDRVDAETAERIGLVNRVVDDAMLDDAVDDLAGKLLANPQLAVRYSKLTINATLRGIASTVLDIGLGYESLTNRSDEHGQALDKWQHADSRQRNA
jgi:enoyl-CoA hydratase